MVYYCIPSVPRWRALVNHTWEVVNSDDDSTVTEQVITCMVRKVHFNV